MLSESTGNSVVGYQFSQHQEKHNESKPVIGKQAAVTHVSQERKVPGRLCGLYRDLSLPFYCDQR